MTIDEAIEREKNLAGFYKHQYLCDCNLYGKKFIDNNKLTCVSLLEEHEQLAEWLEELKEYKKKPEGWMWDEAEIKGYNKAIDDFTEAVKELIVDLSVIRFKDIDEIAEQLKEGTSNETYNQ